MALSIRGLCRLNVSLASNCLNLFKPKFMNVGVRFMYTDYDLRIQNYENLRYSFQNQFMQVENTFREKMKEICKSENGVIYSEDMKAMLHLAKATDEDMELLDTMLQKYISSQQESGFTLYRFGPTLMRMYYHLDQPKFAVESFMNPLYKDTYNYRVAYRILICLLYKHKMFNEAKYTFEHIMKTKGVEYIGTSMIIMFGMCMVENTPESFKFALEIWKYSNHHGIRTRSIMANLALKQNSPEVALNALHSGPMEQVISIRSLKILIYAQLERYIQIIPMLKFILDKDLKSYVVFQDVVSTLESALQKEEREETPHIKELLDKIKERNLIRSDVTLEEFLLQPLVYRSDLQKVRTDGRKLRRYSWDQDNEAVGAVGLQN